MEPDSQRRQHPSITLAKRALQLKLELLISNKSYEFVDFKEGDFYDEKVMECTVAACPPHGNVKYQILPASYEYDWEEFSSLEAARVRNTTFFPAQGAQRSKQELLPLCKARVVTA
jgi:hypothetical protein